MVDMVFKVKLFEKELQQMKDKFVVKESVNFISNVKEIFGVKVLVV